ncbi:hypothetical protein BG006_007230 [Podila minutissima]|uniref:Peroxisomal membrane protein PEX14 n=1 Tax=Podila minutissima TaxID=64525 RepID=A0A9P5VKU0_9FUNG|nr:hypothetical protein BG006_007230 [Podila minutissima]
MSDDNTNATGAGATSVDPVHQLLQSSNNGQPMTAEQRNERREALLKRQKESREKAQQISQAAKANAIASSSTSAPASTPAPSSSPAAPPAITAPVTPVAPVAPIVSDAPIRENMVQQAVSFLSSPSVQSADEAKKTQFLEKKGLTLKEIELARSRVAGGASGSSAPPPAVSSPAPVAPTNYNNAPPPVPPRTYAPTQAYPQQQVAYYPPPQQVAPVDPKAFQKKLVLALLISGGVTALTSIIVQKFIYPMVRGITGARRSLVGSQIELLAKLKERLTSYKDYLLGLNLGSNHRRPTIKQLKDADEKKDTKTTVEDEDEDLKKPSKLKATRAMTQDLAEYITKETYALTTSIAYPTSRYYGYNASGAASSGKGGLNDPTTPESALKSEIRSLKGLLLNWRNFPTAATATGAPGSPSMSVGPSLVQRQ